MAIDRQAALAELLDGVRKAAANAAQPEVRRMAGFVSYDAGEICDRDDGSFARRVAPLLAGLDREGGVASAFATLASCLKWYPDDAGYATADIIGDDGIATSDRIWFGATAMTPGSLYPLHSHAPEEFYLFLSSGAFRGGDESWQDIPAGGAVYNRPWQAHALKAGAAPLVALWFLAL